MKRFTETEKWADPWFRRLSSGAKLLWLYLCDHCDPAGVIEIDLELIHFMTGAKGEVAELGDRVEMLGEKVLIKGFISFQYGKLSEACKPHKAVFAALERAGLSLSKDRVSIPFQKGLNTLQEKEKEKEKEKDKVQGGCNASNSGAENLEIVSGEIPPVTLEAAKSKGDEMMIESAVVESWWLARDAVGWQRKEQPIKRWISDLKGYHASWQRSGNPMPSSAPRPAKKQANRIATKDIPQIA